MTFILLSMSMGCFIHWVHLWFIFCKLYFMFWGTCEEHARSLHRYTHGSVICCLPPHHPDGFIKGNYPALALSCLPPYKTWLYPSFTFHHDCEASPAMWNCENLLITSLGYVLTAVWEQINAATNSFNLKWIHQAQLFFLCYDLFLHID